MILSNDQNPDTKNLPKQQNDTRTKIFVIIRQPLQQGHFLDKFHFDPSLGKLKGE